jgi:hypothetical protein
MFPTPFEIGWHTCSDGAADAHGNPVTVYTPALNLTGTQRRVMGWGPTRTIEPNETRVQADLDLFVPPDFTCGPKDVADLPEGSFEVVGWPEDWTKGMFSFAPGKVVKLKRVVS